MSTSSLFPSNQPRVVFLDAGTLLDTPNFKSFTELGQFTHYEFTPKDLIVDRISDAEVVITNKVVIDKQIIDQCPNLRLICISATGTNNVDLIYAKSKGIEVKNAVNYSTNSVAQLVWGLILNLNFRLHYYDGYVKSGEYANSPFFTHTSKPFNDLSGKILGIIGLSRIGRQVASIGQAFGMKIVYTSVSGKSEDSKYQKLNLDELLKISDVISIHTPLTDASKGLINSKKFQLIKQTAILINSSRGSIVEEKALVDAIDNNVIAGAGLDVFEVEPLPSNSPLLHLRNQDKLILTPHIGWASIESRISLIEIVKDNIKAFTKNQPKSKKSFWGLGG